jgi:Mg2+/Co2+ transporter CorB
MSAISSVEARRAIYMKPEIRMLQQKAAWPSWRKPRSTERPTAIDGLIDLLSDDVEDVKVPRTDRRGRDADAEFVEAISDPEHEEHERFLRWVGGSFDPTAFDLAVANTALQRVR